MTPEEYVRSGKHLPKIMRDFHDQKDIFKDIHHRYTEPGRKEIDWISAQIYTVDWFLWYMGQRGYTLQKSKRKDIEFKDFEFEKVMNIV